MSNSYSDKKVNYQNWLDNELTCLLQYLIDYYNNKEYKDEVEKVKGQNNHNELVKQVNLAYDNMCELINFEESSFLSSEIVCQDTFKKMFNQIPLTPLTGKDDEWNKSELLESSEWYKCVYINKRYPALRKYILSDDRIIYIDSVNTIVYNVFNETYLDYSLIFKMYYDGYFKIEFPYKVPNYPDKKIYTNIEGCHDILNIGDTFVVTKIEDTLFTHSRICNVNRIFQKVKDTYSGDIDEYEGITSVVYQKNKQNRIKHLKKEIEKLKQSITKIGFDDAYSKL